MYVIVLILIKFKNLRKYVKRRFILKLLTCSEGATIIYVNRSLFLCNVICHYLWYDVI